MADPTNADGTAAAGTTEATEETTEAQQGTSTEETTEAQQGTSTEEASAPAGEKEGETPEDYGEFELPEGMELDQQLLEKALPTFKELGLSKEQAQKLVDIQAQQVQSQIEAHSAQVEKWTEAVKNDKDLGGENFDKSIDTAKLGLDKVGSPELKELLNQYGLGSHPEVVRAFHKIGKLVQEDNPESGARASDSKKSIVERLYPTSKGE